MDAVARFARVTLLAALSLCGCDADLARPTTDAARPIPPPAHDYERVLLRHDAIESVTGVDAFGYPLADVDPVAVEALSMFCAMLGGAAGNLALTLGARGGVYIGGGIVRRLGGFLEASPFRARFEDKGRFRDYLSAIPTSVITAETPALHGLAAFLEQDA